MSGEHPFTASHVARGLCPNVVVKGRSAIETVLCARPVGHAERGEGGCSVQPQSPEREKSRDALRTTLAAGDESDANRLDGARGRLGRALKACAFDAGPVERMRVKDLADVRRELRARLRGAYARNASIATVADLRAAVEAIGAVFAWMEEP